MVADMSGSADRAAAVGERWLLLVHQLPAKPAYFRVKIWRRLNDLGAVLAKNAVTADVTDDDKKNSKPTDDATVVLTTTP